MNDTKKFQKKYGGKYVAFASFTDEKVIASGKDPIKVHERAVKKGFKDPVIDYVHEEGVPYCY
jgi:hypothetical protein